MTDEKQPEKQMTVADLRQMADLYHVPITDETLKGIAGDSLTPQKATAFENYVKTTAEGLYPTLAPQIRAGIPTAYLLDPYRQVAKQKLGENFEPNFQTDPAAQRALTGGVDPTTGRPAPMSLSQWQEHLMSEPSFGYANTPEAMGRARQVIDTIRSSFEKQGAQ